MESPFSSARDGHTQASRQVHEKHRSLYARGFVSADACARRERALALHLFGAGAAAFEPAADTTEAFFHWGARLLHRNDESDRVHGALLEWLEENPELAEGALRALHWFGERPWHPGEACLATETDNEAPGAEEAPPSVRAVRGDNTLVAHFREELESTGELNPEDLMEVAITGTRDAAEWLLELLANPRFARLAETPWYLLTGQRLRRRPRLSLVGERPSPPGNSQERTATDHAAALAWWRDNQSLLKDAPRGVLLGQPLDNEVMRRALVGHGGWAIERLLEVAQRRLSWETRGMSAEQPIQRRLWAMEHG